MTGASRRLVLRNARLLDEGGRVADVAITGDRVAAVESPGVIEATEREADLDGRVLRPGIVNGHDHLD